MDLNGGGVSLLYDLKATLQVFLVGKGEVSGVGVLSKESHDVLICTLTKHLEIALLREPTVILKEATKGVQELILFEEMMNHLIKLLIKALMGPNESPIEVVSPTAHHGKLSSKEGEVGVLKVRLDLTLKRPNIVEVVIV
jgi:hypothetical protein